MKLLFQAQQIALTGACEDAVKPVTKEDVRALTMNDFEVLHAIMVAPHVSLALHTLQRAGFFDWLIPEIQEGLDLKSSKQFKEIWPHTLRVVSQTPPKLALRWAALFHDLGKAQAFSIKKNKVTFHHHEKISAKIFDKFAKKVKIFGKGQRSCIHFLVSNLGYAEGYESDWTDSAVRRFAREMDIYLDDLLTLSEADITTGNPKKREKIIRRIHELKERVADIKEKDSKQSLLPKGLGNIISEEMGIPIGPEIGQIRKILEEHIEAGLLLPNQEFGYYIEFLKNSSELLLETRFVTIEKKIVETTNTSV
jgi:poly(A) polymerase